MFIIELFSWFMIMPTALFVLLLWCAFNEDRIGVASFFTVVFGLILIWARPEWYGWMWNNPIHTASGIGLYLVFGCIFSFIRNKYMYRAKLQEYVSQRGFENVNFDNIRTEIQIPNERKSFWIVFWPFSVIRFTLEDVLLKLGERLMDIGLMIVNYFRGFYERTETYEIRRLQKLEKMKGVK